MMIRIKGQRKTTLTKAVRISESGGCGMTFHEEIRGIFLLSDEINVIRIKETNNGF